MLGLKLNIRPFFLSYLFILYRSRAARKDELLLARFVLKETEIWCADYHWGFHGCKLVLFLFLKVRAKAACAPDKRTYDRDQNEAINHPIVTRGPHRVTLPNGQGGKWAKDESADYHYRARVMIIENYWHTLSNKTFFSRFYPWSRMKRWQSLQATVASDIKLCSPHSPSQGER